MTPRLLPNTGNPMRFLEAEMKWKIISKYILVISINIIGEAPYLLEIDRLLSLDPLPCGNVIAVCEMLFFWIMVHFVITMLQVHPVPSPRGLNSDAEPFFQQGSSPAWGLPVSLHELAEMQSLQRKHPESAQKQVKSGRCMATARIKRSFYRACRRAIATGSTSYHGRILWEA